jgi:hypothetical protein
MTSDMDRAWLVDDVWICIFDWLLFCYVLRRQKGEDLE